MDDIWWILLCVLALLIGLALGFGAGSFGRVFVPRARWQETTSELESLRTDNAALRATEARLEGELETARLFARVRGEGASPDGADLTAQLADCEARTTELEETVAALESQLADHGPLETSAEADDLTLISGVGPYLEQLLHANGVTTFAQIAALDDAGIDELQSKLEEFPGRIRRDDWVAQAAALAEG
ncbi:MAG: hypothetical protein AAGA17_07010 [Actinomycetota bacterium]